MYYRVRLRGASQNKIDDDGKQQLNIETKLKSAKGENVNKRLCVIALFSLYRDYKNVTKRIFGKYLIPESAF